MGERRSDPSATLLSLLAQGRRVYWCLRPHRDHAKAEADVQGGISRSSSLRANPTAIESRDPTRRSTMSIVVRFPPSNVTRQQYDSVRNALTESGDWPADGCQLHVLFGDENDLRVSEVWESREKLDAFGQKLRPKMDEAGMQLSGEPEVFEAHIFETF